VIVQVYVAPVAKVIALTQCVDGVVYQNAVTVVLVPPSASNNVNAF